MSGCTVGRYNGRGRERERERERGTRGLSFLERPAYTSKQWRCRLLDWLRCSGTPTPSDRLGRHSSESSLMRSWFSSRVRFPGLASCTRGFCARGAKDTEIDTFPLGKVARLDGYRMPLRIRAMGIFVAASAKENSRGWLKTYHYIYFKLLWLMSGSIVLAFNRLSVLFYFENVHWAMTSILIRRKHCECSCRGIELNSCNKVTNCFGVFLKNFLIFITVSTVFAELDVLFFWKLLYCILYY